MCSTLINNKVFIITYVDGTDSSINVHIHAIIVYQQQSVHHVLCGSYSAFLTWIVIIHTLFISTSVHPLVCRRYSAVLTHLYKCMWVQCLSLRKCSPCLTWKILSSPNTHNQMYILLIDDKVFTISAVILFCP